MLITENTKAAVERVSDVDLFNTRRLGKIQVVNIKEEIGIHELVADAYSDWEHLRSECERALDLYLDKNFREAAGTLAHIQVAHPSDGPSLFLLAKAVNCLCDPKQFTDVWIFEHK